MKRGAGFAGAGGCTRRPPVMLVSLGQGQPVGEHFAGLGEVGFVDRAPGGFVVKLRDEGQPGGE